MIFNLLKSQEVFSNKQKKDCDRKKAAGGRTPAAKLFVICSFEVFL